MFKLKKINSLILLIFVTSSLIALMPVERVAAAECNDGTKIPDTSEWPNSRHAAFCRDKGGLKTRSSSETARSAPSEPDCIPAEGETKINAGNCEIIRYITLFTRTLSFIVGIVVVTMIAVGGVQYSASRDNPQATQEAKTRIRNAVLALIMYLFVFAFLQWLVPGGIF
jgi:hypothetical protein